MHLVDSIHRRILLASFAFAPPALAQTFPAMPSTSPTPSTQLTAPAAQSPPQVPSRQQPRRARVELVGDRLAITADNSSLNQILRDIARLTGIKITGGVADERVFGSYGPAPPSSILEALLSGTGSNMLLLEDLQHAPRELVLTPRQGGPTPPNPTIARDAATVDADEDPDLPPQLNNRFGRPRPSPPPGALGQELTARPNEDSSPTAVAPSPVIPAQQQVPPQPGNPFSDTTTQQSPNGVKTPQQIFDQLLRMRQAQPQSPPAQSPPAQAPPDQIPPE